MKRLLCSAVAAVLALAWSGAACAQAPRAPSGAGSAAEARAFVARAEAELDRMSVYASHAAWLQATYINTDSNFINAKASAEQNELAVELAKGAARFNGIAVDPVTRRKLELIKRGVTLPAPSRPGAAQELADIQSRLTSTYSTGKMNYNGKTLDLDDLSEILRTSRDPAEIRAVWEGWRRVSPPMKADYQRLVALSHEGAVELGYKDAGALWRSWYDMEPDAFAAETDRLWNQVKPLYANLHCYVRAKLNAKYGDAVQPKTGPIRADLLGNMWAQEWGNIYDVVAPNTDGKGAGGGLGYDLTERLTAKGYDPVRMVKTGESFYTSLGFAPLPQTFWERSQIVRPRDREVVCHASAWDVDGKDDVRLKACIRPNADDFFTVHHELGHNIYQRAYNQQSYLFRDGANDGFHEAIGDFAGLSALTPTYLKQIGLIDTVPGTQADIPYLLNQAMDRVAFLPFGLLVDKWRWEVFAGKVSPAQYNDRWWALVKQYQGLVPPGPRPTDAFDPGAKFHVADQTPYMRYFLARIYQFQFYRAACEQAGWTGPLNRCSIYGNKDVGRRFDAMLKMGTSQPWPEELAAFTGERKLDASAIADYFAPLNVWLTAQNQGRKCGW